MNTFTVTIELLTNTKVKTYFTMNTRKLSEEEKEKCLSLKLRKQTILKQIRELDKTKWDAYKTVQGLWETVAELNSSMKELDPTCDTTNKHPIYGRGVA